MVTDLRWDTYAPSFTAPRPSALLDELPAARRALDAARTGTTADAATEISSLSAHVGALPAYERADAVLDIVRRRRRRVLGHASAADVDPARPFTDLGIDSLTAVELRNGMNRVTGLRLPSTLVFDHPTCRALADFLLAEIAVDTGAAAELRHGRARTACPRRRGPDRHRGHGLPLPGRGPHPEQLWTMLLAGEEGLVPFPEDRGWDLNALFDSASGTTGTVATRTGGFLDDAGHFDPAFFNISPPREALAMDPQQRLLLEMAWRPSSG